MYGREITVFPLKADHRSISLSVAYRILLKIEKLPASSNIWTDSEKEELLWACSVVLGKRYMKKRRDQANNVMRYKEGKKKGKIKYREATPLDLTPRDCYRLKYRIGRQLHEVINLVKHENIFDDGEFESDIERDIPSDMDLELDSSKAGKWSPIELIDDNDIEVVKQ